MLTRVKKISPKAMVVTPPTPVYDAGSNRIGDLIGMGWEPESGRLTLAIRAWFLTENGLEKIERISKEVGLSGAIEEFKKLISLPPPPKEYRTEIVYLATDNYLLDVTAGYYGVRLNGIWDYKRGIVVPFYLIPMSEARELNERLRASMSSAWTMRVVAKKMSEYRRALEELKDRVVELEAEVNGRERIIEVLRSKIANLLKEREKFVEAQIDVKKSKTYEEIIAELVESDKIFLKRLQDYLDEVRRGSIALIETRTEEMRKLGELRVATQEATAGVRITREVFLGLLRRLAIEHPDILKRELIRAGIVKKEALA